MMKIINKLILTSAILLSLSGCIDNLNKEVELQEIGRCDKEAGTLVDAGYVGWTYSLIKFVVLDFKNSAFPIENCIPDLNPELKKSLTDSEKNKLNSDFFYGTQKRNSLFKVDTDLGVKRHISIGFITLQDAVRRGSELAYLELHLTDYFRNHKEYTYDEEDPYYQRLKTLAESGDADAMCLYSRRIPKSFVGYEHLQGISKDKNEIHRLAKLRYEQGPDDKWLKGMVKAAKMGASDCMSGYASWLMKGELLGIKIPKNPKLGMEYIEQAAILGSRGAMHKMAYLHLRGSMGVQVDLGKTKCWSTVLQKKFPLESKLFDVSIYLAKAQRGITLSDFPEYDPDNQCKLKH